MRSLWRLLIPARADFRFSEWPSTLRLSAEIDELGNWTSELVDSSGGKQVGRDPDLAFSSTGDPRIAYEIRSDNSVVYGARNGAGVWSTSVVADATSGGIASQPSIIIVSRGYQVAFVQRDGLTHRLQVRSSIRVGITFIDDQNCGYDRESCRDFFPKIFLPA